MDLVEQMLIASLKRVDKSTQAGKEGISVGLEILSTLQNIKRHKNELKHIIKSRSQHGIGITNRARRIKGTEIMPALEKGLNSPEIFHGMVFSIICRKQSKVMPTC